MMGVDLARAFDPVLLARDCGLELDEWQSELLRTMPRRALLCCCRQAGKTTIACMMALWVCLYEAPALALIVSPSQRQSGEAFRTLMSLYARLQGAPALIAQSVLRCELANGSRIVALPGSERTTRGFAKAALVIVDEAARVEDDLWAALRPMLATSADGGRFVCLSTPAGRRGQFFESWEHGGEVWTRVRVPASAVPRISQAFLDEELKLLGLQRFSEEYDLQFLDPDEAVFPTAIIDAAFSPEVVPLWN
jgi:hypothetical protein